MRTKHPILSTFLALAGVVAAACAGEAQNAAGGSRPEDTEFYEPVPPVVHVPPAPGMAPPPADAIILFDGTNLNEWVNVRNGEPASWIVEDGVFTVNKQAGDIRTRRSFQNFQIHLEWRVPTHITGSGQSRGNSGLFLANTGGGAGYELQILDSHGNETYVNGMAGSVYKQSVPLANPTRAPGEWNVYDVIWTAPTFNADGSLQSPGRVTAFFNGVVVQNNFELTGRTTYNGTPTYQAHGPLPILLQAHADPSEPISFRNIWVRELP